MKKHFSHFRTGTFLLFAFMLVFSISCGKAPSVTTQGSEENLQEIAETEKTDYDAALDTAEGLLSQGQYEEAYALLTQIGAGEVIAKSKYERGVTLFEQGEYSTASELFTGLNYLDSERYLSLIHGAELYNALSEAEIGQSVYLGTYEQDGNLDNGAEDIEWLVLDKPDGHMLLLSRYALDCLDYEPSGNLKTTWENSAIKYWLNSEFFVSSFTDEEKSLIVSVNTESENYALMNSDSASDKVFLLSKTEAEHYFRTGHERACICTDYAVQNKAWCTVPAHVCRWWLRSDGCYGNRKAGVRHQGSIYNDGFYVNIGYLSVRPAICISSPY